jgi:FkbM family methyltransferase
MHSCQRKVLITMFPKYVVNLCQHTFLPLLGPDSVVFDFGANNGDFAHGLIKLFGCRVFSAEPVRKLAEAIPSDPRLQVLPVAVSAQVGRTQLQLFQTRCASMFGAARSDEDNSTYEEVDTITLFEFKRRTNADCISLLKVDIEGAELGMFETASTDLLDSFDQITVEFHDFLYPEMTPRIEAVKCKLQMIGFSMVKFSMDNTDVLFVNKRLELSWINLCWLRTAVKYSRGLKRKLGRRRRKPTT